MNICEKLMKDDVVKFENGAIVVLNNVALFDISCINMDITETDNESVLFYNGMNMVAEILFEDIKSIVVDKHYR